MKTKKLAVLVMIMALAATVLVLATRDAPAGETEDCLAGICGPKDPPVKCSNGVVYPNICAANADCQYDCQVSGGGGTL